MRLKNNFEIVSKSAVGLLSSMAVIWIVVHLGRAFISGKVIFSELMIKMTLFIGLSALLQFKIYDDIVVKNLELLFNGLPTMFSDIKGDNVVEKVLIQSGIMVDEIVGYLSGSSWLSVIGDLVICFIMLISIIAFTLVVVLNVLANSVKFYMVLSLGSISCIWKNLKLIKRLLNE